MTRTELSSSILSNLHNLGCVLEAARTTFHTAVGYEMVEGQEPFALLDAVKDLDAIERLIVLAQAKVERAYSKAPRT
jgi:hypothetical protein